MWVKQKDSSVPGQEHKNNIKLDHTKHSVITEHMLESGHSYNWDEVKVLDTEHNYYKRLISEMLHIRKQKHGLNSIKTYRCLIVPN